MGSQTVGHKLATQQQQTEERRKRNPKGRADIKEKMTGKEIRKYMVKVKQALAVRNNINNI